MQRCSELSAAIGSKLPKAGSCVLAVAIDACGLLLLAAEASLSVESSCGAEGSAGCTVRWVEWQRQDSLQHDRLTDTVSRRFDAAV